ncbi:MAG: NAD+ synthase [Sediminibacterium sp. Gen4]|jgi:NAD+ synthase (glutamine-hydrolysing)|uniref:NAD+ synthase n=1 Tax=unclassified Sediminibacterium TaxID=2635961 RepID=UPI0015BB99AE|nr:MULTISPECIES: NAD+ synthase [unclassified Sediminibacterium]MBW0162538.1 NAD+ synthase [Sediminibacterium sp.]MBW0164866.1 NAD+ synthase [Sediminibacterium sp.]NWK65672.1 NAD+ synthase [Sediminibacterium sp. Gen4]
MKISIAQQNYHIGNFEENTCKIIAAIEAAKAEGSELIIFSEMSVCGYPARDFVEFSDFIDKCYQAVDQIKAHADTIAVLIGSPAHNTIQKGKDLFNAAFFLYEKEIKAEIHKTLLPTYDVFDEYRYFEPAYEWKIVPFKGKKLAITICEDIWNLGDNPLYRICPMDQLMDQQPDVMLNISASPFDYTHDEDRKSVIKANVQKYKIPMFYCNSVGSQTEIIFDGASLVFDKDANLCGALPMFQEAMSTWELNDDGSINAPILEPASRVPDKELNPATLEPGLNIAQVYDALIMGIRDYFSKMGFSKAILGSSGGIDSAVTLAIACDALGKENVRAILMPSPYSTDHSVNDAVQLSKNLGNPYDIIRIDEVYESFLQTLKPVFNDLPFSLAEENIQSRSRGNLLMAIANKFGYILLNTSNKSELATGYGTLYGDMAGGLGVLGDCYKLQVYELAQYINREKEIIPTNIITKAPSAELRPNQKDSDSLPDYTVLDQILYQYIEKRKGPAEIKAMGYDVALVDRTLKMVNNNEYKRNQFCPIIRISPKAFGVGRRVPIVGKYLS